MLEMVQQSHDMLGELQKQVFTMNIRGASLKADMTEAVLETTRTAKALMKEVDEVLTVAKKAAKQHNAWLTLNKAS
jgi:hypothetical protein